MNYKKQKYVDTFVTDLLQFIGRAAVGFLVSYSHGKHNSFRSKAISHDKKVLDIMTTMTRNMALALTVLTLAGSVVSCGGDKDTSKKNANGKASVSQSADTGKKDKADSKNSKTSEKKSNDKNSKSGKKVKPSTKATKEDATKADKTEKTTDNEKVTTKADKTEVTTDEKTTAKVNEKKDDKSGNDKKNKTKGSKNKFSGKRKKN